MAYYILSLIISLVSINKSKDEMEEKVRKMKILIVKLKKEIEDFKAKESASENLHNESNDKIQTLSLQIDDFKMQLSDSLREKEKIQTEVSIFCI